jgi:hypothetical protein
MSSNTLAAAPAPNTTGTVNNAPRRGKRAIIREQDNNQSRRRQRQNEREIPHLDALINLENMPEPVGIPRNQVNQRMVDFERQQQANNDEFQEEQQQQARGKRSRKSRTRKSRRARKSRRTRRNRRY